MVEPVAKKPAMPRPSQNDASTLEKSLRTEIIGGGLSPNEHLIEADVAARYGVNRNVVRAAFAKLEMEGLVERSPNRGARVRMLTTDEAVEITEARLAIEGLCAAKAAERATDSEIQQLRSLIETMKKVVAAGDIMQHQQLLHEFHKQIRDLSRHSVAISIAEQLRNQVIRHVFREALVPGRLPFVVKELESIVDAIEARDPRAADSAMREHQLAAAASMRLIGDHALFLRE